MEGEVPVHLRELLTTTRGVRDENRLAILRAVMEKPGPQSYLSRRAGLSEATVSDAISELTARGLIVSEKSGRTNIIRISPTAGAAVGIELGLTHTVIVARRVEQAHDEARISVREVGAVTAPGQWARDVAVGVHEALDGLGEDEIVTIGLAIPRAADSRFNIFSRSVLPSWSNGDDPAKVIAEELRKERFDAKVIAPTVVVDNDAMLAAYAERIYAYESAKILVSIKTSSGIGAGIVVGGKIFRGSRGAAGDIGHIVVQPGGRLCYCGGRGCLDAVIGADALVEQVRLLIGRSRAKSPDTLEDLAQMAAGGNPLCQRVLTEAGIVLGSTIDNLCSILNPEVVVLYGALVQGEASKYTIGARETEIPESAARRVGNERQIIKASTLLHPAAHGALVLGLHGGFLA